MQELTRRTFLKTSAAVTAMAGVLGAGSEEKAAMNGLLVGVAAREVTPDPGVKMWGYSDRKEASSGVLDPLMARALVFRNTDRTIGWVVLELGRVPTEPVMERIRAEAEKAGIDKVIFSATHTHGGPIMESDDAPHVLRIEKGIIEALEEAAGRLTEARVGIGHATLDISHNRRVIKDGECYMLWRNEKRVPTSPLDHEATLIKLDDAQGKPLATLVHFACHPVVLGADNVQYTSDFAGHMARLVKAATGAECFYVQGGCGDINPYLDKTPLPEGGIESMHAVGKECADGVLAALKAIPTQPLAEPVLAYYESAVEIGTRFDFTRPDIQDVFRRAYGPRFDAMQSVLTPDLSVPLVTLVIGRDIGLAFMPGELFVQFQLDLKSKSAVPHTLLCGYANGFHLYFPTVQGAAAGGYGGLVATYVGAGAGDKLVAQALTDLGRISGRVKDRITVEDFNLKEL
ncbi:MAG: neutral/alkaline non-lysosomal ceramidase N-terminal domain-containing protein [Candidatus Hydrogenedentes bacterium]|nr:neutral/alkaline non-lysosomal ceramidase N-terminal domain-containing protein [Candidatus Hydrogenedentota bacterium]